MSGNHPHPALAAELGDTDHHKLDVTELDVTELDNVRAFAEFARARHRRIDVLINNAGVMPLAPLDALHVDEWNTSTSGTR
jgi:NADP-dependent 3-hydroxy acid dehydrogenase YdfG